ncbi:M20 aminoacylase family protein [Ideonella livida]|uniref:Amidohydrolase n=1 Tax=Ideonella livida TaxID=2707176 RepID=A0A7C9THG4_9BURK|nr:M20 aminoacylase family protein [Ideonella livida]NDY90398.1 amidohydrolase [Ideonella livida]
MQDVLQSLGVAVEDFIALRRQLHRYPELAFDEHRTAALVAEHLTAWGYKVTTGLGGTGVVGTLQRGPAGGPRLGLRADMDALPIQEAVDEEGGRPWTSQRPGLMHACGHDGHTAMLLAAALALSRQTQWRGTLHLIFQPAEEGGGGALRMMADGLFTRFPCDAIFALHNMPGLPKGHLAFRDGPTMASSDYASITLHGTGGHGAMPHRAADPVVAASSLVMALQTLVSRNVDPMQMAVVTVGALHAGQANNVIPAQARLELSLRALDPLVRSQLHARLQTVARAQAESFGVRAEVDWRPGYAVLINHAAPTALARTVARELLGPERVIEQTAALPGSEDFAFMLEQVPGSYAFIGNGDAPGGCMVHHPGYDFDDDILATGAAFWLRLAETFFSLRSPEPPPPPPPPSAQR